MMPPTFQTTRFTLKPYSKSDEEHFIEMGTDERVVQFMGGSNGNIEEERALFKKIFEIYEDTGDTRIFHIWGIYEQERMCGHLELKQSQHTDKGELEIVYMVHPEERGRGLMAAVLDFIKQNQQEWKSSIIATVNPDNKTSLHLLKKWGITKRETVKDKEGDYLKLWLATD